MRGIWVLPPVLEAGWDLGLAGTGGRVGFPGDALPPKQCLPLQILTGGDMITTYVQFYIVF